MEYILHLIFTNILRYTKATEHCVYLHAQLQQSWAHCDQLHEHYNAHWREHCVVLSTLRTVFRCIALMRTSSHVAQVSSVCLHFHPWSSACALVLECSLHTVSLLLPQVLLPPLPDSCHGAWRDFHGRSPVQLQLREHGQPGLCHTRHKERCKKKWQIKIRKGISKTSQNDFKKKAMKTKKTWCRSRNARRIEREREGTKAKRDREGQKRR